MDRLLDMRAEFFHPSAICPLCANAANPVMGRQNGHLICPYCQSRFVLSTHGQFVRDPFRCEPTISIQQLRRQSRPLARLIRDAQTPLRTIVGGVAVLTIGALTWVSVAGKTPTWLNPNPLGESAAVTAPSLN
jgi:hypothetical protein